jgi:hypothetical protein
MVLSTGAAVGGDTPESGDRFSNGSHAGKQYAAAGEGLREGT